MKKLFQSITGGYASSAKVVDGTLILSLPDALSPVVWRMDLEHVQSSALEVREQDNGTYMLTLKTPREDLHNIAPFSSRGPAVRALMAASRALEQGQGRSRVVSAVNDSKAAAPAPVVHFPYAVNKGGAGKWLLTVLVSVAIVIVFLNIKNGMQPPTGSLTGESTAAASRTSVQAPSDATGVPVPADDFLRGR